jgi:hypothetical protein
MTVSITENGWRRLAEFLHAKLGDEWRPAFQRRDNGDGGQLNGVTEGD